MKIKFLGAAGTVTGSSYALTSGSDRSILIDFGMFQGIPEIENLNYNQYDFDCRRLLGVVLTHAHLDHCGRLPLLLPKGFRESIFMTSPTADLTELSLLDSAKIATEIRKEILYDKKLAEKTIRQFKLVSYGSPIEISDFTVTFRDAGHILGSASVEIVDKNPDSDTRKIVFSGDLGNSPENLVRATELIEEADAVVMESTYGDRVHPKEDPTLVIESEIRTVEASGGVLLIPAFALDRTQEILHMIKHLKQTGRIPPSIPVFMDSPMANKATLIYQNYPEMFNDHVQNEFRSCHPFDFPGLNVIGSRSQSEKINEFLGPKVIIAGGGMMTGGRILHHSARYLPLSTTRLLIVGYQGEETLGRELKKGNREVVIDGQWISVKATVKSTDSMSSHADQQKLITWLRHIKNVKKIILTHGEDHSRADLSQKITGELGVTDISLPALHQEITL